MENLRTARPLNKILFVSILLGLLMYTQMPRYFNLPPVSIVRRNNLEEAQVINSVAISKTTESPQIKAPFVTNMLDTASALGKFYSEK